MFLNMNLIHVSFQGVIENKRGVTDKIVYKCLCINYFYNNK